MPNFFDDPDLYKILPSSLTDEFLNADLLKLGGLQEMYLMLPAGMSCKIAVHDSARIPIFGGPAGGCDASFQWLTKTKEYQARVLMISSSTDVSYRVIFQHTDISIDEAVDVSIAAQSFTRAILKVYERDSTDDRQLLHELHTQIEVLKANLRNKP